MFIQEDQHIVMQTECFPDSIANKIAAVKHRDLCLIAREKFTVYINQDVIVTIILDCIMGSMYGHRWLLPLVSLITNLLKMICRLKFKFQVYIVMRYSVNYLIDNIDVS